MGLIILILSFHLKSQDLIASITSYELKKENVSRPFIVEVKLKNGETILFDYRSATPSVYDSYADSTYCTLIFDKGDHFLLSAAFRDTINNKWIVDYKSSINKKTSSLRTIQVFYYDIKIIDGLTLAIEYELKGLEELIKRRYKGGDLTFHKISIATLTKDYIYDQVRRVGIDINWLEVENSPRPPIEYK